MPDLRYNPWTIYYGFELGSYVTDKKVSAKSQMQAESYARSLAFLYAEGILLDHFKDWRDVIEYDNSVDDDTNYETYLDYIEDKIDYGVVQ